MGETQGLELLTADSVPMLDYFNFTDFSGDKLESFPDFGRIDGNEAFPGIGTFNVFQICLCAIGLLGNIIVIILVLSLGEFKKGITTWYILQLSIADTIFLLTIPFQVLEDEFTEWIFSESLCKAKTAILYINYYSSISFLTVMAIDRYIAVCHGFSDRLKKLRTHKAAYIVTASVWLFCVMLSIPTMIYSTISGIDPNCKCHLEFPTDEMQTATQKCEELGFAEHMEMCASVAARGHCVDQNIISEMSASFNKTNVNFQDLESLVGSGVSEEVKEVIELGCYHDNGSTAFRAFLLFNFSIMFIVPCVLITTCYVLIIRHLRQKSFHGDSSSSKSSKNIRSRVIYMCVTLVFVFIACWLPYHAQHIAKIIGIRNQNTQFCVKLFYATSLLVSGNSAINPFIYFIIAQMKNNMQKIRRSRAASAVITFFRRDSHANGQVKESKNTHQSERERCETKLTAIKDSPAEV